MSENAQIKSIIEGVLRHRGSTTELQRSIVECDDRHVYALSPLLGCGSLTGVPVVGRAMMAAGHMLGCDLDAVRHKIRVWTRKGSYEAAQQWARSFGAGGWKVGELPDCVGFVYLAAAVDFPGLVKVGFSKDPARRVQRLSADHRCRLELQAEWAATWLDEHLAHLALIQMQLANEWFDAGGALRSQLPLSRFHTPARMWAEINATRLATRLAA